MLMHISAVLCAEIQWSGLRYETGANKKEHKNTKQQKTGKYKHCQTYESKPESNPTGIKTLES